MLRSKGLRVVLLVGLCAVGFGQDHDAQVVALDPEVWERPTWPMLGYFLALEALHGPPESQGLTGFTKAAERPRLTNRRRLIQCLLGPDALDGIHIESQRSWLMLFGPEDRRRKAVAAIKALEDALPRFQVRLRKLAPSAWDSVAGPFATREATAKLLTEHAVEQDLQGQARSGGGVRLVGARWSTVVYDYDVSNSRGAVVGDPLVGVAPLGVEFVIRPWALAEGRTFVCLEGRNATLLGESQSRSNGNGIVPGPEGKATSVHLGSRQALHLGAHSTQSSAILDAGESLLVGIQGSGEGPWLCTIAALRTPTDRSAENAHILRCQDLTAPCLQPHMMPKPPHPLGSRPGNTEWPDKAVLEARRQGPLPLDRLCQLLGTAESDALIAAPFRDALCLGGTPERLAQAAEIVNAARHELVHTFEMELRWGELPLDHSVPLDAPAALAAALTQRGVLGARTGDWAQLFAGESFHYLRDYDIELTESTAGPDPVIWVAHTGFAFCGRPHRLRPGLVRLDGELLYQVPVRPTRVFDPESDVIGTFDQLDLAHVRAATSWDLEPGRWTILRTGPLPGLDRNFVCLARIRAR